MSEQVSEGEGERERKRERAFVNVTDTRNFAISCEAYG